MKLTQREKNRQREHEPHGWEIITDSILKLPSFKDKDGTVLVSCPCGWKGWVSESLFKR